MRMYQPYVFNNAVEMPRTEGQFNWHAWWFSFVYLASKGVWLYAAIYGVVWFMLMDSYISGLTPGPVATDSDIGLTMAFWVLTSVFAIWPGVMANKWIHLSLLRKGYKRDGNPIIAPNKNSAIIMWHSKHNN